MADEDRRELLYRLLGDLPERDRDVSAETISVEKREGCVVETLLLDLNGTESVPAVLARPSGARDPAPVILYSHAHGNDYELGKRELVDGRDVLQEPPYASALTRESIGRLCNQSDVQHRVHPWESAALPDALDDGHGSRALSRESVGPLAVRRFVPDRSKSRLTARDRPAEWLGSLQGHILDEQDELSYWTRR